MASRPLLRPRSIVLALVGLLVFWIGRGVYLALTAVPGKAIDYSAKVADLVRRAQSGEPEGPDGWPILVEAIERVERAQASVLGDDPSAPALIDYSLIYGPIKDANAYGGEDPAEVRARSFAAIETARTAGAFESLDGLAATHRAVRPLPPGGGLIFAMLPDLGKCRNLARMNAARMCLAAQEGDSEELVRATRHNLAIARANCRDSFLICHLVGYAITSLTLGELRRGLMEHQWDEAECAAMLEALDGHLPLPPLSVAYEGERLSVMDTIQMTHTDDGRGSGRLIVSRLSAIAGPVAVFGSASGNKLVNLSAGFFASKRSSTRKANEIFDELVRLSAMPRAERSVDTFDPDSTIENLPRAFVLLKMILPSAAKPMASRDAIDLEGAGTRIMVAIELHRARHGGYPAALDALAPSILAEIPRDPIAGAFVYRVGPTEDGRPYLLYSIGADLKDDGGKPHPKASNEPLQPNTKGGYDYVINVAREKPGSE